MLKLLYSPCSPKDSRHFISVRQLAESPVITLWQRPQGGRIRPAAQALEFGANHLFSAVASPPSEEVRKCA